jgi:hypothetical protein
MHGSLARHRHEQSRSSEDEVTEIDVMTQTS